MGLKEDTPVPLLQIEEEFGELLQIYKDRKPGKVLEIGVKDGGTLYHWIVNASPGATIVGVDKFDIPGHNDTEPMYGWGPEGIDLKLITGDSHDPEIVEKVNSLGPFDWVFIDGDHSYEGVRQDFQNYGSAPVVAFHDILPHPDAQDCEVWKWWIEAKREFDFFLIEYDEIIHDPNQGECGIGVVYLLTKI